MGMSASQARYLGLVARQNDLEYQGQQINQERTVLSQQVTDLYNSLQNMTVPTPPSTTAYTTITYSGSIGATSYSFDASTVRPGTNGNYIVTVSQQGIGDSLKKNTSTAKVDYNTVGNVNLVVAKKTGDDGALLQVKASDLTNYYVMQGNFVRKANANDFDHDEAKGTYTFKKYEEGKEMEKEKAYYQAAPSGSGSPFVLTGSEISNNSATTVNGNGIFTLESALANGYITQSQKETYEQAIANSGLINTDGKKYDADSFYIYFDKENSNQVNFVLQSDINDRNDNAVTYAFITGATINVPYTYDDCKLDFDTSGRISSLSIPNYNEAGEIVSYTAMKVEAKTVTDDAAYKDAYAQYEYSKYLYDKTQQEINAKTEVIQQEDKQLELKLQRLDNERTQITTEIEAVDKVINDNIEASYKTFSG